VSTCELCRRRIEGVRDPQAVQTHHLRPEERQTSPTATLCRPCHEQVHALFTNAELRESFDTVDALREADRLQKYIAWIRTTDKLDIETRTSDHVRER
jgi:5-methylcytosine-specific restriction protein A